LNAGARLGLAEPRRPLAAFFCRAKYSPVLALPEQPILAPALSRQVLAKASLAGVSGACSGTNVTRTSQKPEDLAQHGTYFDPLLHHAATRCGVRAGLRAILQAASPPERRRDRVVLSISLHDDTSFGPTLRDLSRWSRQPWLGPLGCTLIG